MGRVTGSGSSHALRRAIFPRGFAGEVMNLILDTWQVFSLNPEVRWETRITAVFHKALIAAYVAAGRDWFVNPEDPITDPTFGTESGRNDLRFYPPKHHGQTVFFAVECKRLHVTTDSRFTHGTNEYVKDGMLRFLDREYSAGLPCGGMLGYVMDNRLDDALASIQEAIKRRRSDLRPKGKRLLRSPSSKVPSYRWSADTFHQRDNGEFRIHHLLVGVPVSNQRR